MEFVNKYMGWESLKPEFIKIYAQAFSADEFREINKSYRTEVGSKTIKLMPTLMAQGDQIVAFRVQSNIGGLQAMIQAEANRLQKQ